MKAAILTVLVFASMSHAGEEESIDVLRGYGAKIQRLTTTPNPSFKVALTRGYRGGKKGLRRLAELPVSVLTCDCTRLTDDWLGHIGQIKRLRFLAISSGKLTDDGLVHLNNLMRLETLLLYDAKIKGHGIRHLRSLRKLTTLGCSGSTLAWNGLTMDAVREVASLPYLTNVLLGNSNFRSDWLEYFENHRSVVFLYVHSTKVTKEDANDVMKANPGLEISANQRLPISQLREIEQLVVRETRRKNKLTVVGAISINRIGPNAVEVRTKSIISRIFRCERTSEKWQIVEISLVVH